MRERTPEEIALERIDTAASKGLHTLDLRGIHLATLPAEIGRLTHLTTLLLRKHQLTTLPPEIGQLTNLNVLELNGGRLKQLPSEIGHLTKLTNLELSANELVTLPPEFGRLTSLTHLYIAYNQLTSLPEEFGGLTNLITLDLSSNRLTALPAEIGNLKSLKHLNVIHNPFTIEPEEVIAKTSQLANLTSLSFPGMMYCPEVITSYDWLWAMRKKRNLFGEAKLFFVGDRGVGKTSLYRRLIPRGLDLWATKTEGASYYRLSIKIPSKLWVNIWDFGGRELLHPMNKFCPTNPNLFLLVLDTGRTQEENRVDEWLKFLQTLSRDTPVLIVGNKSDQHPLEINQARLQTQYPNIIGILETSAKTGTGIKELKTQIASHLDSLIYLRPHEYIEPSYDSPSFHNWRSLRAKLESLSSRQPYIFFDEFLVLYNRYRMRNDGNYAVFLGSLHDLGILLYFQGDPELDSMIMLRPHRVIDGMYKILRSETLLENDRRLTSAMIDKILNRSNYDAIERTYILNLMRKFELCVDTESDQTFFVPEVGF